MLTGLNADGQSITKPNKEWNKRMAQLFHWQQPVAEKIISALQKHRFCIAACCTGSGKTFLALEAVKRIGGKWLVIGPKATRTSWLRAAEAMNVTGQILDIFNPEKIAAPAGCAWYTREGMWRLPSDIKGVVFDEIHRGTSGPKSVTTLSVAQLKAYPVMLLCMSATPASSPLGMRATSYWAGLNNFTKSGYYSWCRAHGCEDASIGYGAGAAGRSIFRFTKNRKKGQEIMAKIRQDLGEMFVALSPDSIPDFPTETRDVLLVDMSKRDVAELDKAYEEMSQRLKTKANSEMAAIGREREKIEWIMTTAVADLIEESVENGYSAVSFWNYTEPRERVTELLRERGITDVCSVYGGQKDEDRTRMIDEFQDDKLRVALVNASAGGAGISLQGREGKRLRESFIIPSYSAPDMRQCMGRIRRVNGSHASQHVVLVAGSAQERVAASLERKLQNLDSLLDSDLMP
jgi:hypothetical protein